MNFQAPQPGGYLSPLANIFPALTPVINSWSDAYNQQANLAQNSLQTRMGGQLANAGILSSPTGQSIESDALARQSGQFMSGYTGQLMGLIPQLGQMAQTGYESQQNRDFQAQQALLAFQHQQELMRQGVTNQLNLAQGMIPIDSQAYTTAANLQRQLFPPNSIGGVAAGMSGGGMPSGYGLGGLQASNTNFQVKPGMQGAGVVNPVSGMPALNPNQFSGTQAAGMPGGIDYRQPAAPAAVSGAAP